MEAETPYRLVVTIVFVAVIVGAVVYLMYSVPSFARIPLQEGFVGSDSLRILPQAVLLMEFLEKKGEGMEKEKGARAELELLLQKMEALMTDLTSTDRVVKNTLHLPFETAHDRMVVGELCGMCLQQTSSTRDMELFMGQWRERGLVLLRKLCTAYNMSEQDALFAEKTFIEAWSTVNDVVSTQCIKPLPLVSLGPRDATPYEPIALRDARSYDYRYGGLSASGWNGTV